jgi:hypothetical protein
MMNRKIIEKKSEEKGCFMRMKKKKMMFRMITNTLTPKNAWENYVYGSVWIKQSDLSRENSPNF